MSTDPTEAQPPPPDDSYPGEWLTQRQAAAVRESRTRDLAAQLGRLTHEELLDTLNDALAQKES